MSLAVAEQLGVGGRGGVGAGWGGGGGAGGVTLEESVVKSESSGSRKASYARSNVNITLMMSHRLLISKRRSDLIIYPTPNKSHVPLPVVLYGRLLI